MERLGSGLPACSRCSSKFGVFRFPGVPEFYCALCVQLVRKELSDAGDERYTWPHLVAEAVNQQDDKTEYE